MAGLPTQTDHAARMVWLLTRRGLDVELVVRGASPDTAELLRKMLGHKVTAKPPTSDRAEILADLKSSDVVAMPSVAESFGLEAAAAGIPVLVPVSSGVGQFFRTFRGAAGERSCVEQGFEEAVPVLRWTDALERVLRGLPAARLRALLMQNELVAQNRTWDDSAAGVETVIEKVVVAPGDPGPTAMDLADAFGKSRPSNG